MKLCALFIGTLTAAAFAAEGPPSSSAPDPAKVQNAVKETDLTTVVLTSQATQRLGITTVAVEKKPVPAERLYGGEITLPLTIPENPDAPGAALFALAPPQNPAELLKLAELQAMADGEVQQARVKVEAAKLTLDRAEKLLANQTGSERAVEDARAAFQLAMAAHDQAVSKRALLGPGFDLSPAGNRWWVRVAVLAADAPGLDASAMAKVQPLGGATETRFLGKRMLAAPATANAQAATFDWYYGIEDPQRLRRPGERVEVRLPLAGAGQERLVIPWAAVLHDIYGGQWVYENTAENTFVRRRVLVERVAGTEAVLARGLAVGVKIVTDGAPELFGTEFGPGK